jgi:undecaprenyl-phosphate galactose phosphotransferase
VPLRFGFQGERLRGAAFFICLSVPLPSIVTSVEAARQREVAPTGGVETGDLDFLLRNARWNLTKPWNLALKRAFDMIVATAAGILLAPLLILIALAIRLNSPGPVLSVQQRLGRGWRRFPCVKFRTMYVGDGRRLREHPGHTPKAHAKWERVLMLKSSDPGVTRVGQILCRLSLDKLPQLVNVMNGHMSLVGPRPYLPSEAQRMGDIAETILKVPPGLTGLWQVSRRQLTFNQRVRLDEYYVRNWSPWMDIVVLGKAIGAMLRRLWAF